MPHLADVSVLLALCAGQHAHHRHALEWLSRVDELGAVAICRLSQLGLCRLLSNGTVMGEAALNPENAWAMGRQLLSDERFVYVEEPRGIEKWLAAYLHGPRVSRNLWTDAYLAAFAKSSGMGLVSLDRDFRRFAELELQLLG